MRRAAVGDEHAAARIAGDMPRIFESAGDDCFRLGRERGETDELFAAQREQPSLRVESNAARIRECNVRRDFSALDVHDEQLVLPHQ